ncbi:lipopolysaccharide biosynthesis protein [Erythrobacter sp. YT30]|uniref:lipopolysaccharide biosynthesis protein n=1 Tax=Erythrobacter sp. YT30 TaxID=1735012 RepID=UPI00076D56F6|nr:lipopolysaccharide biosynthesis protein [Erythrobacter sp. YT30]KWV90954.1 hypothetical protein AUC45_06370 [Erythrobacter sp. YT30]
MMEVSRSKLLKGAGWVSAASVAVNSLGIVSTIILARLLMPSDFGLVAIATALVSIIGVISEFSLSKALIQHRDPSEDHYHTAWTMNVIRGLIVGGVIAALGHPLSAFYDEPRLTEILWVLGFITFVGAFVNPKLVVFERELSFSQSFTIRLASKVAGFCTTVSIAWIYQSYWALVFGVLATETAIVAVSYLLIPFRPKPMLREYRELLSFSIWLTFGRWVQALNWRATPLLFGYLLPPSILGQYSLSSRLVSKTLEQATSPIKALLFPAFSRLQDDKTRLRLGYMRSQGALCLIVFPIAAGFAVLAEDIVRLAIGTKWLPAVPLMQIVAATRIIQTFQNIDAIAMATANTKRLFHRDLRAFFIRWPLVIAGLYAGYVQGDADAYAVLIGGMIGQIGAVSVNCVLNARLVSQISPVSMIDHGSFIWRPLCAILVMIAIVYGANNAIPNVDGPIAEISRMMALVALGAITYPLILYALWVIGGKGNTVEHECAGIVWDLIAKARVKLMPKEG